LSKQVEQLKESLRIISGQRDQLQQENTAIKFQIRDLEMKVEKSDGLKGWKDYFSSYCTLPYIFWTTYYNTAVVINLAPLSCNKHHFKRDTIHYDFMVINKIFLSYYIILVNLLAIILYICFQGYYPNQF